MWQNGARLCAREHILRQTPTLRTQQTFTPKHMEHLRQSWGAYRQDTHKLSPYWLCEISHSSKFMRAVRLLMTAIQYWCNCWVKSDQMHALQTKTTGWIHTFHITLHCPQNWAHRDFVRWPCGRCTRGYRVGGPDGVDNYICILCGAHASSDPGCCTMLQGGSTLYYCRFMLAVCWNVCRVSAVVLVFCSGNGSNCVYFIPKGSSSKLSTSLIGNGTDNVNSIMRLNPMVNQIFHSWICGLVAAPPLPVVRSGGLSPTPRRVCNAPNDRRTTCRRPIMWRTNDANVRG